MPTIKIKGMSCGHCVASVTNALEAVDGVSNVSVTLETGEASYTEERPVDTETLKQAIAGIGFEVV